jgi:hypothetical protein
MRGLRPKGCKHCQQPCNTAVESEANLEISDSGASEHSSASAMVVSLCLCSGSTKAVVAAVSFCSAMAARESRGSAEAKIIGGWEPSSSKSISASSRSSWLVRKSPSGLRWKGFGSDSSAASTVAVDGEVMMRLGTVHSTAAADLVESVRTALHEKEVEMDGRIGDLSDRVRHCGTLAKRRASTKGENMTTYEAGSGVGRTSSTLAGWATRSLPMREKSVEEAAATEVRVFLIMVKDIIVVKERLRDGERERASVAVCRGVIARVRRLGGRSTAFAKARLLVSRSRS